MNLSFFFNDTATTEIYTLSLHDALPICYPILALQFFFLQDQLSIPTYPLHQACYIPRGCHRRYLNRLLLFFLLRSEEHTSELQSRQYLVCRLLLEKKKNKFQPL